jgi:hypothetical protein
MLLQWLSNSPTAWEIDQEIGKLDTDFIGSSKKDKGLIRYLRYNIWLDATTIGPLMNKQYSPKEIDGLVEMSNAASRFELYDIGAKAAVKEVSETHFPDTFKI